MSTVNANPFLVPFLLTAGAGLATVLGGLVIFSKKLVHVANPQSLALSLSVSGGVMVFISFVELFGHAVNQFTIGVQTESMDMKTAKGHGWLLTGVCFAAGILLTYGIDAMIHKLHPAFDALEVDHLNPSHLQLVSPNGEKRYDLDEISLQDSPRAQYISERDSQATVERPSIDLLSKAQLNNMGVLTALAIGVHNIPEGVATFVGASHDQGVGFSLAFGIALHNIPEGVAVAAPIYFATGSRTRGILWCFLSAIAEPFGGFLAWLVLGDGLNHITEGILFGVVTGVMICISFKELFPTALKFAEGRTSLVAWGAFAGMYVMLFSMTLFAYVGI